MTEYVLSEYFDGLNDVIIQPIQLTQRIKYTCCDVSKEYIVFGASSGGLYIFHRNPCSFDKLIPSTEGSIVQISISPDEKLLAFATSKGTICLVEINSKNLDFQLYNEHSGNVITAMKWTGINNELFAGDNTGKMSIITYTNFITKTMFQNLCSPILQLESKIVQIDTCNNLLLVSTLTRCYLFDTFKEQYRQIGQKLRDGEYGGCFFGSHSTTPNSVNQEKRGVFKILGEKESFNTSVDNKNTKIFCSRPGLRLWEVDTNGFVLRTHQFKNTLNEPCEVIKIKEGDALETYGSSSHNVSSNFTKIYFFNSFLLSYNNDLIFILDPSNGKTVLWTNTYSDINEIKVVGNHIYVVTQKLKIHHLNFASIENFAIKSYLNKNYLFCANVCTKYLKNLLELTPNSHKLHFLTDLQQKLTKMNETETLNALAPLFELNAEPKPLSKKLENGIFVVDNAHYVNNTIENSFAPGPSVPHEKNGPEPEKNTFESDIRKIYEQYELYTIIGNQNTKVLSDILNKLSFDDIYNIFSELEEFSSKQSVNVNEFTKWCHHQLLGYLYTNKDYVLLIFNSNLNENLGRYIKIGYENVNYAPELGCVCNFPLPKASKVTPTFFRIGCSLLEKIINDQDEMIAFVKKVPYMWKQVITLQKNHDLTSLLPLLIQFSDPILLESFLPKFTYDHWLEALKLFILLNSKKCLKCESYIEIENCLEWNTFASLMLKSIGAESTVELLLQYSDKIPTAKLDFKFYQSLIFNSMAVNFQSDLRVRSVDFIEKINENDNLSEFEKLLEKTLQNPSSTLNFNNQVKVDENCCSCEMPISLPILSKENPIFLQCGHKFHTICYKNQKNLCNIYEWSGDVLSCENTARDLCAPLNISGISS